MLEVLGRVHHRKSFGEPLISHALIRRDLTDMAVRLAGGTALAFYSVAQFDPIWREGPPFAASYHTMRFLTHLAKNRTAEHAAHLTQMGMELFGGLGFLEEYAIARWHREALITPIWEGPSNIQSLDFLETIVRQKAHEPFREDMAQRLTRAGSRTARVALDRMDSTLHHLTGLSGQEAEWFAKSALRTLADVAQVALLYGLADDEGERCEKLATLYGAHFLEHEEYPAWAIHEADVWNRTMGD